MIAEAYVLRSSRSRAQLWSELVTVEGLDRWSAIGSCVSTGTETLEPAHSYVCVLHHGDAQLDASVVVTDFEPGARLGLRTSSPMAVVHERIDLEQDGRGTLLRYAASATSSMFGPAVTVWLHDHVTLVRDKLATFTGGTEVTQEPPGRE